MGKGKGDRLGRRREEFSWPSVGTTSGHQLRYAEKRKFGTKTWRSPEEGELSACRKK